MKKLVYLFAFVLVALAPAMAQNSSQAKVVLDAVSNKLKTYQGVTANFAVTTKNRVGKTTNQHTGKLSLKGNKYYIKQGAMEIFSNGDKTWNFNGNDEVTVTPAEDDSQNFTPQKLMSNFHDQEYLYKIVSSSGGFHQIQMTPKDKRKNFQKITVFVDKSKMMVTRASVLDKSGNTTEVRLNTINTGASLPETTFVFDKSKYNKNIEVIE